MNQVKIVVVIVAVLDIVVSQHINNRSLTDKNLLLRPPGDIFVLDKSSNDSVRIQTPNLNIHCQLLPNSHFTILINEDDDETSEKIPEQFLVNGIQTSEEIFEIITFKTPKAPRTTVKATHIFCGNNKNCEYYDFSRN